MPPVTYLLPLPTTGITAARRAANELDPDDLREAGLAACRVYFPGQQLVLRLDGPGDLLPKLRHARTGALFLAKLDEHAWFDEAAKVLTPVAVSGDRVRGHASITGVHVFRINAGHEEALWRELPEVAHSLDRGPYVELLRDGDLVLYVEAETMDEIGEIFTGAAGAPFQRLIHEHTSYDPQFWRDDFALDQEAIRSGLASQSPPTLEDEDAQGTRGTMPPFRTPQRP